MKDSYGSAASSNSSMGGLLIKQGDIEYEKNPDGTDTLLGKGGFGYVKKATLNGRDVAVKTFVFQNDKQASDPLVMASIFLEEAKNMKKFQHPRIVGLVGIILETGSIVMEYMSRGSLYQHIQTIMKRMQSERVNSNELFPWSERTLIALDIAQGMAFLHSKYTKDGKMKQDLFHQDLKSANVLLCMQSGRLRAKISDFGMSVIRDNFNNQSEMNTTSKFTEISFVQHQGGTLSYMAPELFSNKKFTKQCDVYAYGVILLELALLSKPSDVVKDFRLRLAQVNLQDSFREVILSCLDINPKVRPSFKSIAGSLTKISEYSSSDPLTPDLTEDSENATRQPIPRKDEYSREEPSVTKFGYEMESSFGVAHHSSVFRKVKQKMMSSMMMAMKPAPSFETDSAEKVSWDSHKRKHSRTRPVPLYKQRVWQGVMVGILATLIVVIVILVLRFNQNPNSSSSSNSAQNQTQSSSTTTFIQSTTTSTATASPSPTMGLFAGASSFNLFAVSESDQIEVISALRNANVKVVRMHVTATFNGEKSSSSKAIPDLEPSTVGSYDDRILQAIDATLYRLHSYGLKAIIAFHDRHASGCYSLRDAYYFTFQLPAKPTSAACNDAIQFYTSQNVITAYENRIKHILDYSSPNFNGTSWSQLDQVIYGFDIQNRAQFGNSQLTNSWWCDRATMIKPLLKSTIKVITGGTDVYHQSLLPENGECPYLDIVGFNHYFSNNDIEMIFQKVTDFGKQYNKPMVLEQFCTRSFSNNKSQVIRSVAQVANTYNVSWIVWQVMKPGTNVNDCEFFTSNADAWSALKDMAGNIA